MDIHDIVSSAYEAAFLPEMWPALCDKIAKVADAFSSSVFNFGPDNKVKFVTSPHMTEAVERFARSDVRSPLPAKQLEKMPFAFQRDVDLLTEAEIENDPLKNKILMPLGLKWQMGDAVIEPSGHVIVFDLLRRTTDGPFSKQSCERLDLLKPDLLRALFVASRSAFQEATSAAQALADIGLPAAVISDTGMVTSTNTLFKTVPSSISIDAGDRIRIGNPRVQNLLDEALEGLSGKPRTQSIPVAGVEDETPLIINVIPIRRHARDIFSKSAALLVVNKVGQVGPPSLRVLCGLFDLTPSEARVSYDLACGLTIEQSAIKQGLAVQSVRTYLKRVYNKTGTSQQSELVSLLLGFGQREL